MRLKLAKKRPEKLIKIKTIGCFGLITAPFILAYLLMRHTFAYSNGYFLIASKVWSDFAAHLPLIRSFSLGSNLSHPQYPIFANEPIRYHFLFYTLVGWLEKIGLPIDLALNLPSAFGLGGLIVIIFLLAKTVFIKKEIGLLAVLLFLFNSSLSFIYFFQKNGLALKTLVSSREFASFGPYDNGPVSAFWNLNIYTNQRHLALSFFLVLLVIYLIFKKLESKKNFTTKDYLLVVLILAVLPNLHQVGFVSLGLILNCFFVFYPSLRKPLFKITVFSLPLILFQLLPKIVTNNTPATVINLRIGFLSPTVSFWPIVKYWLINLGLSAITIPVGFLIAKSRQKKLLLSILPLFIIGNLFQFSPEIAANHKFFNLFLIIGNFFSAFLIFTLWHRKLLGKGAAVLVTFFLILSGIIDLPPILNDRKISLADLPHNQAARWIAVNTDPDSTFLNSNYLYHPANLAGRKIYLGWPYFAWSAGYNTKARDQKRQAMLLAENFNQEELCQALQTEQIDYVFLDSKTIDSDFNFRFWQDNFQLVFENDSHNNFIFAVKSSCDFN